MWFIILAPWLYLALFKLAFFSQGYQSFTMPQWMPWLILGVSAWLAHHFHRYRLLTLIAWLMGWWVVLGYVDTDFWWQWVPPASLVLILVLPAEKLLTVRSVLLALSLLAMTGLAFFGDAARFTLNQPAVMGMTLAGLGLFLLLWVALVWKQVLRPDWIARQIVAVGSGLFAYQMLSEFSNLVIPMTLIAISILIMLFLEIYEIAFYDQLTRIPGRRSLTTRLGTLGRQYSLAMADIDHFKNFNDKHGHDVGDQVLKMVAAKLAQVGGGGKAYRYGGEEFTILFPGKTVEQSEPFLEQIRSNIENYPMAIRQPDRPDNTKKGKEARGKGKRDQVVSVTISMGVTARQRGEDPDSVMKRADEALYLSKKRGRNRVSRK